MKIGLVANIFISEDWEECCKITNEAGLEVIEVATGGFDGKAVCNPGFLLKSKDDLDEFLKVPKKYNLEISAFGCKGNPLHPDKRKSEEFITDILQTIELAKKTGINTIIVFAGTPGAGEDARYPNWISDYYPVELGEAVKWQWEKKIIPFWKDMVKKINNTNIRFAFELHMGDAIYNPESFLKLRKEIDSGKITCNMDPSHLFPQGIDIELCIRRLGDTISYFHVKDCKIEKPIADFTGVIECKDYNDSRNRSWNYRTLGYGHSKDTWKNIISALKIIGYDGVLSIEYEDALISPEEGLDKSVRFLKDIIIYKKSGKKF